MSRFEDEVAIVTGGAQGIGAYARALAAEGARVAIADIRDGAPLAAEIAAAGGEAVALRVDVTDTQSVRNMVEETVSHFGGIDILINNAALFADLQHSRFEDIDDEEGRR